MLLTKLALKNFKRFGTAEVVFRDGVTGIVGNNGAGKSTIVEAVLFALYGVKSSGLSGEYIVSSFAPLREKCEVRLDFQVGGEEYTILRTFRRTASSTQHDAQMFLGGNLLAEGVNPVEGEVARVIGMGAADFKSTIYAGQKDLLSLLDERPGDRKNWFMRVLGIDYLKNESDALLREEIREKEKELDFIGGKIDEYDHEALLQRRAAIEAEIAVLQDEIRALHVQQQQAEQESAAAEQTFRQLTDKKVRYITLCEQERALLTTFDRMKNELAQLHRKKEDLQGFREEFEQLAGAESEYTRLSSLVHERAEKKEQHERCSAEQQRVRDRIAGYEVQIRQLGGRIARLEEDARTCRELEPSVRNLEMLRHEAEQLDAMESRFRNLWKIQADIDARYRGIEDRVHALRAQMKDLEEKIGQYPDMRELEHRIEVCSAGSERLLRDVSARQATYQNCDRQREELEGQLAEIRETGEEGICPTCNRPLGDHYHALVRDLEGRIRSMVQLQEETAADIERLVRQREEGMADHASLVARHRQLADDGSRLAACRDERTSLMRDAEHALHAKAAVDAQIHDLGYDPDKKRDLEAEMRSLEGEWRAYLEANERLKAQEEDQNRLSSAQEEMHTCAGKLEKLEELLVRIGFDAGVYRETKEAHRSADAAYRRYIEVKGKVAELGQIDETISAREAEAQEASASLCTLRKTLEALSFAPQDLEAADAHLQSCREQVNRYERTLMEKEHAVKDRSKEGRRLAEECEKLEALERRMAATGEKAAHLRLTRRFIGEYITHLLHVVRNQIEGEVGRVLGQITDGRYEHVLIDDNFGVLVHDMGENYPVNRFSGGEQDDIAIAMRIALSRYLAGMHQIHDSTFLIFDEIFGSQDEERRNNLLQALRTQETHFPQIFLISHIPDIQGEFANTLLVEMVTDNASTVREMSQ
ncbi:MAG: SMC family ATPase [Methanomicrobiaceae archaeon]|nr:SMC family ATPase [Methanomicrobiaceae archaeon]